MEYLITFIYDLSVPNLTGWGCSIWWYSQCDWKLWYLCSEKYAINFRTHFSCKEDEADNAIWSWFGRFSVIFTWSLYVHMTFSFNTCLTNPFLFLDKGIDIEASSKLGIKVARIPSGETGNATSCAEMAIYLMLGLLRKQVGLFETASYNSGNEIRTNSWSLFTTLDCIGQKGCSRL